MPEPQQNKDERRFNGFINSAVSDEIQKDKTVIAFALETA